MSGAWVFVCGPSGAGKDSVIGWAREHLAGDTDVVFAQRHETRPSCAGADRQGLGPAQFERLLRAGGMAWHWQAHGFQYGIASRYQQQVDWGRVVVVNGSREHVAGIRREGGLRVVQVTADAAELATRLLRRGREAPAAVAGRLARNMLLDCVDADLSIANDGTLEVAGRQLACYLECLRGTK